MRQGVNKALMIFGLTLYYLGMHRFVIWLGRNNPKVVLYHDISTSEDNFTAGLDCTVCPELFGKHLDYLGRHYNVVSIARLTSGTVPPKSVAITFDDGYRSLYLEAFPVLKKRGFAATIYLIGKAVNNHGLVWVNELNYYLREYANVAKPIAARILDLPQHSSAEKIIENARVKYSREKIDLILKNLSDTLDINSSELTQKTRLYLNWAEIREMQEFGITFGNHTMSHPNMACLSPEEQRKEIAQAQELITARLGEINSFAYPFGYHDKHTADIANEVGLLSVAEVGGSNKRSKLRFIGRVHVSNLTEARLFAQMEVVEPVKVAMRRVQAIVTGMLGVQHHSTGL